MSQKDWKIYSVCYLVRLCKRCSDDGDDIGYCSYSMLGICIADLHYDLLLADYSAYISLMGR